MQAIILAAGMGTRIPQYTQEMPKCMIKINGKPLLSHTVEALRDAGIARIVIGLGYKGQVIRDFLAEHFPPGNGISFEYVENPVYAQTNNIYSLYLTKDLFARDDSLLLESDLIYDKAVLRELIAAPAPNAAVLSPFESWMDGSCCLLDGGGHICGMVGKQDFRYEDTASYYKTVNIWKFSKEFINGVYLPFLSAYMSAYGKNEYYETVLRLVAEKDPGTLGSLIIPGDRWYEVDDIEDLSVAEKRFASPRERYGQLVGMEGGSWRFPGLRDFTVDSNPFFPPARLLSELRYGLAGCITRPPSTADELDVLAAKILGADVGQVCVCTGDGVLNRLHPQPLEASYGDFTGSFLHGGSDSQADNGGKIRLIDFGKRFGLPGLRIKVLLAADERLIRPCKEQARGRLSSLEEYFMQVVGKYKKDYVAAKGAFDAECVRTEGELAALSGIAARRLSPNEFGIRPACPPADLTELATRLLEQRKLLVRVCPESEDGGSEIRLFIRDRASNDILLAALGEMA